MVDLPGVFKKAVDSLRSHYNIAARIKSSFLQPLLLEETQNKLKYQKFAAIAERVFATSRRATICHSVLIKSYVLIPPKLINWIDNTSSVKSRNLNAAFAKHIIVSTFPVTGKSLPGFINTRGNIKDCLRFLRSDYSVANMLAARNHRVLLYVKSVADSSVRHCTKHPTLPVVHELHDIVKWRKPEKLPTWDPRKTGDLQELPPVDSKWIRLEYQAFESLISKLPEDQRKFFTVGFGRRRDGYNVIKKNMISSVQRHIYDGRERPERSHETRIAWFTFQIRNIRERADAVKTGEIMESIGSLTKKAQEFTFKRRKYLNQLRHLDYKRFEWLLENLGVLFKPMPEFKQIRRRPAVDRLTGIICDEIISKKMQAYKDELEAQKIPFLEDKLSILEEIKADEEKMKLASSVDEEIQKTLKLLEQLTGSHLEIHPVQSLEKAPSAIP